jgi:hypothetical protein
MTTPVTPAPSDTQPASPAESSAAPSPATPAAPDSPFTHEREVLYDRAAIRDELSQAQSSPTAARRLSARHFSRLIYSIQYGPGIVERRTAPYSPFTE